MAGMSRRFCGEVGLGFYNPAVWDSAGPKGHETCDVDLGKPARLSGPYRAKSLFMFTQAKPGLSFLGPSGRQRAR